MTAHLLLNVERRVTDGEPLPQESLTPQFVEILASKVGHKVPLAVKVGKAASTSQALVALAQEYWRCCTDGVSGEADNKCHEIPTVIRL